MSKENLRFSIIDGSVEPSPLPSPPPRETKLVPVFEEVEVIVQTLEGPEKIVRKVLRGYTEQKD